MNTPNVSITAMVTIIATLCGCEPARESPRLHLTWQDHMLTVHDACLPDGHVDIWYLEAWCRSGSTDRDWRETIIPHVTAKIPSDDELHHVQLITHIDPDVAISHDIRAHEDEVTIRMTLTNHGHQFIDLDWAQPCIRVGAFTGLGQENYFTRCFIFTDDGLTFLHQTHRADEARYTPGQVYVPAGTNLDDLNPRPISHTRPTNGLIGCVSADGSLLLAAAWDHTHELFQGVITCIHSDPHIGGLAPGETKTLTGKLYIIPNNSDELRRRYRRDFPRAGPFTLQNPGNAVP
jgi:hypothetical protein